MIFIVNIYQLSDNMSTKNSKDDSGRLKNYYNI